MAQDPEAPAAEEPDPIEDSPEPEASDSGQDSPEPQQPPEPAEKRVSAAQAALHAKTRENADLRRQIEALESRRPDAGGPVEEETPRERELRERVEAYEWQTAESVYGPDLLEAYATAAELYANDPTPMGALASYEAYHEARLAGATAAAPAAEGLPSRTEALKPRVDANRSDAASLSQLDNDIEEAKRMGNDAGLLKGVSALLRRQPG